MKKAFLVAGLGFGDESKGATVDFLCRRFSVHTVIRYNGGSQAGHNVLTPDGRHHTFSQFGSGTFVPGVRTYLSRFMLVNPANQLNEERGLQKIGVFDAWDRLTVDRECLVITPFQVALNQLLEAARGKDRHGTVGHGVGQCRSDHIDYGAKVLFAKDLRDARLTKEKLGFLQARAREKAMQISRDPDPIFFDREAIDSTMEFYKRWPAKIVDGSAFIELLRKNKNEDICFEGAQGVLLDEKHGTAPHNSWTNTTFENAQTLLKETDWNGSTVKIGVVRTYFSRHGEGPFPTEDNSLKPFLPEPHNNGDGFQGHFRVGYFDWRSFSYSLAVCDGVDGLAVNHLDVNTPEMQRRMLQKFEQYAPVLIEGRGPTWEDRTWRG